MKSIARLRDDDATRARLSEFVSAGQIGARRGAKSDPEELARLRALTTSLQQKLSTSRSRHSDARIEAKRAQNVVEALTADNARLRARIDGLVTEARYSQEVAAQKPRPAVKHTFAAEVGARLARVASSADSQPEAGPASRELHGWTLEALISGGPAVAHIAHAILRPLRLALEAEGAGANARAAEKAYATEIVSRGGLAAIREMLHESPLLDTLAADIHKQLAAIATPPAHSSPPHPPLSRKFLLDPPPTEAIVHARLRLGGKAADFGAMRTKLLHALAATTKLEGGATGV